VTDPAPSLLLAGGKVLTPDGLEHLNLVVADGLVVALGSELVADVTLDCSGSWVGPGFVDLHTHLREPGQEHKENMESGAAAAAAGGYTAVLAMPNTSPAIDGPELVNALLVRARQIAAVEIRISGAVTAGRGGTELADLEGMLAAGVRWFTDDGDTISTAGLLRRALLLLKEEGGVISEHAEDPSLTAGAIMHEGEVSRLLGVKGMPAVAETLIISRDLALAAETGGAVHIQHVSTAGAVDLIANAKAGGIRVTAEATPHHLTFDHTDLKAGDPRFKMKPPLRTAADVEAVRAGVIEGVIDIVATDHAPHTPAETEAAGLEVGAFGVIGLETAAAAVNSALGLAADDFFDRMSVAPARLGGFSGHGLPVAVGQPANLVVFDPAAEWIPSRFRSRSRNSPFLGRPLRGRVRATVHGGKLTHRLEVS